METSNEMHCRVCPRDISPEGSKDGTQPGRNGGSFTGGVTGSTETEPALEFSEVGN